MLINIPNEPGQYIAAFPAEDGSEIILSLSCFPMTASMTVAKDQARLFADLLYAMTEEPEAIKEAA